MIQNMDIIVRSAIATFLTLSAAGALITTSDAQAAEKTEKCYGIVKAGMNDCQTKTASCAGSATKDGQSDAFLFLPKGSCDKIVGGHLTPENSAKENLKN